MPEYLAALAIAYPFLELGDRTKFPTLLFGPPAGPQSFPLKIMSWNVRRFASPGLKGPFAAVGSGDIGEFLAPYDVVALQEGWDKGAVETIHDHANQKRKALGLAPFALHGPIDFNPSLTKAIEQSVGTVGLCAWATIQPGSSKEGKCETSGTHGGLWVLTALPLAQSGRQVYSDCKGEDCFRAKGAQWVRLYVNPPTSENQACHGDVFDGVVTQSGCDPLGSGDHFIDIFNTHLQASSPQLCDALALDSLAEVKNLVLTASVSPYAAVGLLALQALVSADLNCGSSDEGVRKKQLQELNAYVASVAAKDRPAIIVGDFNLDGKALAAGGEYATLVKELHLGPPSPVASTDDQATPWPNDYDWDVDHSDVVRTERDLTIATLIVGAAFSLGAGGWDLANRRASDPAVPDGPIATAIVGAALTAGVGAAILVERPHPIVFVHEHNLLAPIVRGADEGKLFPTFVFRMLTSPTAAPAGSPRAQLLEAWGERWRDADVQVSQHVAERIVYGSGGVYDPGLLELRRRLFEDLESTLDSFSRDVDRLNAEVASLLSAVPEPES